VLEAAGDQFHALAAPRLRASVHSDYFDAHSELDAEHAGMASELLEGLTPAIYERLACVVDLGWDMMTAITERVRLLVAETE